MDRRLFSAFWAFFGFLFLSGCVSIPSKHNPKAAAPEKVATSYPPEKIASFTQGSEASVTLPPATQSLPSVDALFTLSSSLGLSARQLSLIARIKFDTKDEVVPLGAQLLKKDGLLLEEVYKKTPRIKVIKKLIFEIAKLEAAIRLAHIKARLESKDILSKRQQAAYHDRQGKRL